MEGFILNIACHNFFLPETWDTSVGIKLAISELKNVKNNKKKNLTFSILFLPEKYIIYP